MTSLRSAHDWRRPAPTSTGISEPVKQRRRRHPGARQRGGPLGQHEGKRRLPSREFKDSGPGVKDASRVFDLSTPQAGGKGTGLGLSICLWNSSPNMGSIGVSNVQPSGACFTIELPVSARSRSRDAIPAAVQLVARGGRILLIDHDESVRKLWRPSCAKESRGAECCKLPEARQLLGEQEFDAVLPTPECAGPLGGRVCRNG